MIQHLGGPVGSGEEERGVGDGAEGQEVALDRELGSRL